MKRILLAACAVVLAATAGCGSAAPPAAPPVPPSAAAGSEGAVPALDGTPTDLSAPTQAGAGAGSPPAGLVTEDVVVGSGPAATPADTVDVRYTGTLFADGTLFDSSWSRGQDPVTFPLDGVVPGFAQGIEGMQVGGRRVIVMPPDLAYGDRARGPIPGGSTLVFVVDLVGITPA